MRLLVLTTPTPHHLHFVRAMASAGLDAAVLLETAPVEAPFPTAAAFESERDSYERRVWFAGESPSFHDFAPSREFPSLDAREALEAALACHPDMVVDFGTRRLSPQWPAAFDGRIFNLHGGDPEEYRGLDTHLWAVYHGDYGALVTTLHRLSPELDAGEIVLQAPVELAGVDGLALLRRANTELCVRLTLAVAAMIGCTGGVPGRPQRRRGRYYSFMPAALKDICAEKFRRHMESL